MSDANADGRKAIPGSGTSSTSGATEFGEARMVKKPIPQHAEIDRAGIPAC